MVAAITGGTSFIGTHLIRELLSKGVECYAIVRPASRQVSLLPRDERLHVIRGELSETREWTKEIPGCDVFFHLAWDGVGAQGRADSEIQRRNVDMALACLSAAAGLGAKRFIFSGSQAEYGICDGVMSEETACAPVLEYGKAKLRFLLEARELCGKLHVEYVHLRIFSVYGPGDHPWTLVSQCVDSFLRGKEVPLTSCEQMWNFLHVEDAARAICRLSEADLGGNCIFNVAGEQSRPLREYVQTIWELCGKNGKPAFGAYQSGTDKPHGIEPSIVRLQSVTDWHPLIPFEAGVREMIDAFWGANR